MYLSQLEILFLTVTVWSFFHNGGKVETTYQTHQTQIQTPNTKKETSKFQIVFQEFSTTAVKLRLPNTLTSTQEDVLVVLGTPQKDSIGN